MNPQEFVDSAIASAADVALAFAGEPKSKVRAALECSRANLESELSPLFGAEIAAQIAEKFVIAVINRMREIEAGFGSASRALS
jgi:hypothetical protein